MHALDDNMLALERIVPSQVDDANVSASDCIVHHDHGLYLWCRACVINCLCRGVKIICYVGTIGRTIGLVKRVHLTINVKQLFPTDILRLIDYHPDQLARLLNSVTPYQ